VVGRAGFESATNGLKVLDAFGARAAWMQDFGENRGEYFLLFAAYFCHGLPFFGSSYSAKIGTLSDAKELPFLMTS
jgi:hypothetical protein